MLAAGLHASFTTASARIHRSSQSRHLCCICLAWEWEASCRHLCVWPAANASDDSERYVTAFQHDSAATLNTQGRHATRAQSSRLGTSSPTIRGPVLRSMGSPMLRPSAEVLHARCSCPGSHWHLSSHLRPPGRRADAAALPPGPKRCHSSFPTFPLVQPHVVIRRPHSIVCLLRLLGHHQHPSPDGLRAIHSRAQALVEQDPSPLVMYT